ncbi:MAG: DMT family transporter [Eubacteriaceae bacterium]|nr:DMT family transporter [Eubacteriaceae bacterium]
MDKKQNLKTKGLMIAIFSEFLFGSSYIFIRLCVEDVSVFTLLSWRCIIAFIAMTICVMMGWLDVNMKGRNLKPLFLISLFQPVLYFIMETLGIRLTTASESGVIISCIPIITMCFSAVFLKDRPTRKQVVFMIITVIGAILISVGGELKASGSLLGYLFLLLAMCSEGAYSITSQKVQEFNSAEKTYAMVTAGAIVFTGFALIEHISKGTLVEYITMPFTNYMFGICILFLGLGCNVIAFFCANYAISTIGATRRASLAGIATVVSLLGGLLLLHETFSGIQFVATVLILTGAFGVNKFGKPEQ